MLGAIIGDIVVNGIITKQRILSFLLMTAFSQMTA